LNSVLDGRGQLLALVSSAINKKSFSGSLGQETRMIKKRSTDITSKMAVDAGQQIGLTKM
jgi:hypothetical protein